MFIDLLAKERNFNIGLMIKFLQLIEQDYFFVSLEIQTTEVDSVSIFASNLKVAAFYKKSNSYAQGH